MKRIVCCLLAVALIVMLFPTTVCAGQMEEYLDAEQLRAIIEMYENNEEMFENLCCNDTAIAYWSIIHKVESNEPQWWMYEISSVLLGQNLDEYEYAQILGNLIVLQSGELASQMENQSMFDDLETDEDYIYDIVDIVVSFVGANEWLGSADAVISTVFSGAELISDNLEQAKYYALSIQDYSRNYTFLEAVSAYTDNEKLREAANLLLDMNDSLLEERLVYIEEHLEEVALFEAEFFHTNLAFDLLKNIDSYNRNKKATELIDYLYGLNKNASYALIAFDITILFGDIHFNTTNTFKRYQEMKALAAVADALVRAIN